MAPPTTLHGTRIVASPSTLDAVAWPAGSTVLRFAPDDVFILGGDSIAASSDHAIVAPESGFVGWWLNDDDLARTAEHIEWALPSERPALAQGFIAGVPAKLYLTGNSTAGNAGSLAVALLLTNAAYAHELWERLS